MNTYAITHIDLSGNVEVTLVDANSNEAAADSFAGEFIEIERVA